MTSPSISFPWQPSNPWLRLPEANQLRFPETQPPRTAWHVGALQRELTASRKKEKPPIQPSCWAWRNKIPKSELYYKIAKRLKNINANSTFGFLSFFNPRHCRGHLIFGSIWATISVRYVHSSFEQYSSLFFQKHAATGQRLLLRKMMGHHIHDRTSHHSAAFPSDHSTCLNLATASKWWNSLGPNSDFRVKLQMVRQPEQWL